MAKRGPGRPPSGGRDPVVPVRLPAELQTRLAAVLDHEAGETRSDMIRVAIEREIKRRQRRRCRDAALPPAARP